MLDTKLKGVPQHTCHYKTDPRSPAGMYYSDCSGDWIVLQEAFTHCPFCGSTIEKDPPRLPRSAS